MPAGISALGSNTDSLGRRRVDMYEVCGQVYLIVTAVFAILLVLVLRAHTHSNTLRTQRHVCFL